MIDTMSMRGLALIGACALAAVPAIADPKPAVKPKPVPVDPAKPAEPAKPVRLAVASIAPKIGDAEGGTYVRIAGTRFLTDDTGKNAPTGLKVYFGSRLGTVVRIASDTELIVEAPGGKPGEVVDVICMFEGRGEVKLAKAFTYVAAAAAPAPPKKP